ncbi:MAG: hypothetical protein LBE17_14450 [Treponema sp.]|jgi:hypothetical protein|nr:hypothetical protein [Treponema sp.]
MEKNSDLYTILRRYPSDSPAWSLADAFDAVTNGMDNPESFTRMEELTESRLQPWKRLIYGIRSLYAGDIPGCQSALETIADDSAPGALKPLFRAWIARRKGDRRDECSQAGNAAIRLYRRILVEPHPLSLLAEQAEEALAHGLTEQFAVLAGRIMKSLLMDQNDQKQGDGPLLALRYARYCLDLLDKAGYEDADFLSLTLKNLGEADGFCVLGFARMGKDDNAAASALEKALRSGGGRFLDPAMASLIAALLPALKDQSRRGRRVSAGQPGQPANSYGTKYPAFSGRKSDGQLELFEEFYG